MSINTENTTENAVDNPENREKEDREGFELITEWNQLGALRSKLVQLYIGPEKRYYLGYLDNIRPKGRIADLYLRDCFHPTVNPVEGMRYYYKSKFKPSTNYNIYLWVRRKLWTKYNKS